MIRLELNDEERETLHTLLEQAVSDLGMEIAGTDRLEFREGLKHRRDCLRDILRRLPSDVASSAGST